MLRALLPLEDVLTAMATRVSPGRHLPLTYFDLFANGLTNSARSIYYGMDLIAEIASEVLLEEVEEEAGLTVGAPEHEFLFGFVYFLVEQHLADVNISDCLIDWYDREKQPRFIAPLTSRGKDLIDLIWQLQQAFQAEGRLRVPPGIGVAQDAFLHVQLRPSHYERISVIREFQRLVASRAV